MLSYCLKCRKNMESKVARVEKTKNGSIILSKCNIKKSRFIKEQEPSGILSSLGVKTLLSQNPIFGPFFFLFFFFLRL